MKLLRQYRSSIFIFGLMMVLLDTVAFGAKQELSPRYSVDPFSGQTIFFHVEAENKSRYREVFSVKVNLGKYSDPLAEIEIYGSDGLASYFIADQSMKNMDSLEGSSRIVRYVLKYNDSGLRRKLTLDIDSKKRGASSILEGHMEWSKLYSGEMLLQSPRLLKPETRPAHIELWDPKRERTIIITPSRFVRSYGRKRAQDQYFALVEIFDVDHNFVTWQRANQELNSSSEGMEYKLATGDFTYFLALDVRQGVTEALRRNEKTLTIEELEVVNGSCMSLMTSGRRKRK